MTQELTHNYDLPDGYEHILSGKVRDLFRTPQERILMVTSDRISAYDWVLPTEIPDKGRILNLISQWWFAQLQGLVSNHTTTSKVPKSVIGRAVVCEPLEMFPVECVVRGYLAGSGYADYVTTRKISGNGLPPGLKEGALLPKPLFTPATKAPVGEHDENITYDDVIVELGQEEAQELKRLSTAVYGYGAEISSRKGLILADTKCEFGVALGGKYQGQIILGDEILTPDSSRYWEKELWNPGGPQLSFDKQFVRDWLSSPESGWDKNSGEAPPPLPDEIVAKTRTKYVEAYERITGEKFE
ncbi:MAG TPA: phosphoribosylaminoimidazolesuccinocarboxamide synthase [Actinobacteria bacterium]|nr:phosphoribosylaminoimidazolesuccinocarboxamide synthase [Actinomycetota bacterium]